MLIGSVGVYVVEIIQNLVFMNHKASLNLHFASKKGKP